MDILIYKFAIGFFIFALRVIYTLSIREKAKFQVYTFCFKYKIKYHPEMLISVGEYLFMFWKFGVKAFINSKYRRLMK